MHDCHNFVVETCPVLWPRVLGFRGSVAVAATGSLESSVSQSFRSVMSVVAQARREGDINV